MNQSDATSDDVRVRELLSDIESIGSPTVAEHDRIRAATWAAFERGVVGGPQDEQPSEARRVSLPSNALRVGDRTRRTLLATAASIVLLAAGFASVVLLRQSTSEVVEVADATPDFPVVVLPAPTDSDVTRYTLSVDGLEVGFESSIAAKFGDSGDKFAWVVATTHDAPFDGPTRYGQVLVARPSSIFDGDPEAWFESNGIDAQEVLAADGELAGWSLIVLDGSSRCNGDRPCLPFASFDDGSEQPALAAGVVNEVRVVDVGDGDPFVVFTSTLAPRGGTSFAEAQRLQDDIVQSLQPL